MTFCVHPTKKDGFEIGYLKIRGRSQVSQNIHHSVSLTAFVKPDLESVLGVDSECKDHNDFMSSSNEKVRL